MALTLKTSSSLRTYSAVIWGGSISLALGSLRTCSTHIQLAMAEDSLHKRHPQDHTNMPEWDANALLRGFQRML
jgi:hypothetical protein